MLYYLLTFFIIYIIYKLLFSKKIIDHKNKHILITGAANGIGKSITEKLINLGCYVYATDLNEDLLKNLVNFKT
jgi:hypothetical protein